MIHDLERVHRVPERVLLRAERGVGDGRSESEALAAVPRTPATEARRLPTSDSFRRRSPSAAPALPLEEKPFPGGLERIDATPVDANAFRRDALTILGAPDNAATLAAIDC